MSNDLCGRTGQTLALLELTSSEVERLLEAGNRFVHDSKHAEALPWLERAVALAEEGNAHGRVDPSSLFIALESLGFCYFSLDRFADALRWYERAIAASPEGVELGTCLDIIAFCYSSLGKYAEALPWSERAVVAKGRASAEASDLGRSLHEVGECYLKLLRYSEALPWFERAAAAKEKGDADGHVDSKSVDLTRQRILRCHAGQRNAASIPERRPGALRHPDSAGPHEWLDAVASPFPVEWRRVLLEQVPFYRGLRGAELQRFEAKLTVFVNTKTFSSRQIVVTEEVKLVVAAAACRLTMNLPWEDYARLRHVSVHAKELDRKGNTRLVGRAEMSKVTVSWIDLVAGFADAEDGNNVGYHEFAHALDGADGSMDGEAQGPPNDVYLVWRHVMSSGLAEVRRALAARVDPPIDGYAAKSDAEFFAVATEWFFERPRDLRARLPAVYDVLRRFYRQDPIVAVEQARP